MWLKTFYGPYPNWTYGFSSTADVWKVVARVPVGCSDLLASIDWYTLSKMSFDFFVQTFFCWLLACVYHIYWIIVHWPWILSLGVIANFQWSVSKLDMQISSPAGLWKVVVRVPVFFSPVAMSTLIEFKAVPLVIQVWSFVGKCSPKGHKDLLG